MSDPYELVLSQLKKFGFLLESDQRLPSVCTLITGQPLKGSWWSHPLAQTIFNVNERLEDHVDVIITKLISGKVTFVYRKLWPNILVIGSAREDWQIKSLSSSAKALLKIVEMKGTLSTERSDWPKLKIRPEGKPGDLARELERRLLIYARQVHTKTGKHAKFLESWKHWSARTGVDGGSITAAEAKTRLEEKLQKLNEEFAASGTLPWTKISTRS